MDSSGIGGVPLTMELVKTWQHSMGFSKLPHEFHFGENNTNQKNVHILESICKVWKIKPSKLSINSACGDSTLKVFLVVSAIFFLIIRQPLVSRLPGFVSKQDFVQRLLSDRYCLSEFEAGRFKP